MVFCAWLGPGDPGCGPGGDSLPCGLVALSHPLLHPEASAKSIRRYSQQYVDLIDLEQNRLETLPVEEVLNTRDPISRYIAQQDQGGYLVPLRSMLVDRENAHLVLTFDGLFQRTPLAERMTKLLQILEAALSFPGGYRIYGGSD